MTELFKIGPYEKERDFSLGGEEYSDHRSASDIEDMLLPDQDNPSNQLFRGGFRFSFEECLRSLVLRLPDDEALKVLEGGCGYQRALRNLKGFQEKLGRPVITTGVTMSLDHIPATLDDSLNPDRLIIGTVQNAYDQSLLPVGVHFILDFLGAAYYSHGRDLTKLLKIYGEVLIPGGILLFRSFELVRGLWGYRYEGKKERITGLLEEDGLKIIELADKGDVLAEKVVIDR